MESLLTRGAVSELMMGHDVTNPVVQILGFKKIAGQGGGERYRMNISDGLHSHTFAMLATQLNYMVPSGDLDMHAIIRCDKIISNNVQDRKVLIVLDLTVLHKGGKVGSKIGNPSQWTEANSHEARPPPPAVAAAPAPQPRTNGTMNQANPPRQQSSFPTARPEGPSPLYGGSKPSNNNNTNTASAIANAGSRATNPAYGDMAPHEVMPIRDITPYNNKCAIKARVTKKGPLRSWSNSRGEGKVFNMDLLDDTGEIRLSGFTSAEQFYDMMEEGKVYYIKNFSVKNANRQFSTLENDYEIQFVNDTNVLPCLEDTNDVPTITYNFVDIASIEAAENNTFIDVIGICKRVGDLQTFTSKTTQKEFTKRDITLVDKTNREINLTLWDKVAQEFGDDSQPVVAAKRVKVSDFSGKSLSLPASSLFQVNPDIREAHILRGWYDNEGSRMDTQSLTVGRTGGPAGGTSWKMLVEANNASNMIGDQADYFMSKVTVMSFKRDSVMYKACPAPECKKKVIDNNNGLYRCEKCNKEFSEFRWRLMVQIDFADCTDHVWATCFQETGEKLFGNDSETLGKMNAEHPESFDLLLKEILFKSYIVKFKSKMETFNGENRMKTQVMDLFPLKFSEYAKQLLAELKESA